MHQRLSTWPFRVAILLTLAVFGAVAYQLVSGPPLWSEQGPAALLQILILCLIAGLFLRLAFCRPHIRGQRTGMGAIAALILTIALFDAASLWRGSDLVGERLDDFGNILAWFFTGSALVLMMRQTWLPTRARRFLHLGFALQSIGLIADLGDGGIFDAPQISMILMGDLDEILDMLFLVAYCLGLSLFLRQMLSDGLAPHVRQGPAVFAPAAPSDIIRRTVEETRWQGRRRTRYARMLLTDLLRPFLSAGFIVAGTWRNGSQTGRLAGKSVLRQLREQIAVATARPPASLYYYPFELYEDSRRRRLGAYLFRSETKGGLYRLLRKAPTTPLTDKAAFHLRCRAHGLATPALFLALDAKGQAVFPADALPGLPPADLFIKPNPGKGGRGVERWHYAGEEEVFERADGLRLTPALLLQRLRCPPFESGCVVQACVVNHPDLLDLAPRALSTVRIVTCRDEAGGFEATHAVFRMAQSASAEVDNFHAGGIAAAVDLATGALAAATDLGFDRSARWHRRHPLTDAAIEGRLLPLWPETLALACRAHAAFADRIIIGWDIAILADGPSLIEGNSSPDLDIIQRTHRGPVGDTRLGELLAAALLRRRF